jgi:hypothetical protein
MTPEKPKPCVTADRSRETSPPAQRPTALTIGLDFAALHRFGDVSIIVEKTYIFYYAMCTLMKSCTTMQDFYSIFQICGVFQDSHR